MRRYELTDEQWSRIEHRLPGRPGDPGTTAKDNRRCVHAVLWIAPSGAPWRDFPERFGSGNSVFQRFNRKTPREYDKDLSKERNRVERFLNRIKDFRRVATRSEKTSRNFLAIWRLAFITILLL